MADVVPYMKAIAPVYFGLFITGGHVAVPILILLFCTSKSIKRHVTIINFCATWVVYSILYCLLFYGGHDHDVSPPHALCAAQAILVYGSPCMTVVAGLAVVIYVFWTFYTPWEPWFLVNLPPYVRLTAMILPPYLTLGVFAAISGLLLRAHPEHLEFQNGLYCSLRSPFARWVVPAFVCFVAVLILTFEVAITIMYFRRSYLIKRVCPDVDSGKASLSPRLRAMIFLVCTCICIGACVVLLTDVEGTVPYVIEASLPLAAFFIFSMQQDVLDTLLFWRSKAALYGQEDHQNTSSMRTATPMHRSIISLNGSDEAVWTN